MLLDALAALALAAWLGVLLLRSGAWLTRERLPPFGPADSAADRFDLSQVSVLIPARNEASTITATLRALAAQGRALEVLLIDDQSDDGTAEAALDTCAEMESALALGLIAGRPLPEGWGGKLWALEQGLRHVDRKYCLLLDAEIVLAPRMLETLLGKLRDGGHAMVSIMATLNCERFWEKLLVPPFIFFFKLLYPFARVNAKGSRVAAAAGGCILIRTDVLRAVGAFAAIRDALIDDCALAARVKGAGHSIWLGLSHAVASTRVYAEYSSFRRMVVRTAFTQLRYSVAWLVAVVALMLLVFVVPLIALVGANEPWGWWAASMAVVTMSTAFLPTVRFYRLNPFWILTLPVAALLFLAMTLESALSYARGVKASWKGRQYVSSSTTSREL